MSRKIVSTKDTCTGEPRIDGTRLTCANVVFTLTLGDMPLAEFLQTYSYLTASDVLRCAEYCASCQCVANKVINFCQGCSLDKRRPESCLNPDFPEATGDIEPPFDDEDEVEEEPVNGWELAQQLLGTQFREEDR